MPKLLKGILTSVIMLSTTLFLAVPMHALTITLNGNGSDSENTANVQNSQSNFVTQTNTADIQNNVTATSETGDNSSNNNTGGSSSINTGDAATTATVANTANANLAQSGSSSNSISLSQTVNVGNNGSDSSNTVNITNANQTVITQTNHADLNNNVTVKAETGDNNGSNNTGGATTIKTGNSSTSQNICNAVNFNVVGELLTSDLMSPCTPKQVGGPPAGGPGGVVGNPTATLLTALPAGAVLAAATGGVGGLSALPMTGANNMILYLLGAIFGSIGIVLRFGANRWFLSETSI